MSTEFLAKKFFNLLQFLTSSVAFNQYFLTFQSKIYCRMSLRLNPLHSDKTKQRIGAMPEY
jgi:hypothetical protein